MVVTAVCELLLVMRTLRMIGVPAVMSGRCLASVDRRGLNLVVVIGFGELRASKLEELRV